MIKTAQQKTSHLVNSTTEPSTAEAGVLLPERCRPSECWETGLSDSWEFSSSLKRVTASGPSPSQKAQEALSGTDAVSSQQPGRR